MAPPTKSVHNTTMKMSNEEREIRSKMEQEIVNASNSAPEPVVRMDETLLTIFEKFKQLNGNYTDADSTSLSLLVKSLYRYNELDQAIDELDILDDRRAGLIRQMLAFDKAVQQHMTALSIPLSQRYKLANDIAKTLVEEKRLANMEAEKAQEVNPLFEVLEDEDYE